MADIARGQRTATAADPLAEYVPTSHVGVEIGGGVGLHYHYGTLGQLEHGANYAAAYLSNRGVESAPRPSMKRWPYSRTKEVDLWILAGHRNMEGERAFVQDLASIEGGNALSRPQRIPYRYSTGGGVHASTGWEPLAPAGLYDTFGPEVSFGARLRRIDRRTPIAIAKFTHSGSQIIDWTPEGSVAKERNLYPAFRRIRPRVDGRGPRGGRSAKARGRDLPRRRERHVVPSLPEGSRETPRDDDLPPAGRTSASRSCRGSSASSRRPTTNA